MAKPVLYIKGYKLDHQKMRSQFSRRDDEWGDNYELGYYDPIITLIPETAYKYIGSGMEPDGKLNLVLVLEDEDGYDRKALECPQTRFLRLRSMFQRPASGRRGSRDLRMWSDVERYLSSVI